MGTEVKFNTEGQQSNHTWAGALDLYCKIFPLQGIKHQGHTTRIKALERPEGFRRPGCHFTAWDKGSTAAQA